MKKENKMQKTPFTFKRNAFTMLELVLAIVVLGIITALALPRMDRDLKQEAADNVLSAIRYTQHLALTDNRHRFDSSDWQKSLWQIRFSNPSNTWLYTVASNSDYETTGTNLDQNESAIDPANGKFMHSSDSVLDSDESPNIFLTKKYGIDSIVFNSCHGKSNSTAQHIAFDHLGRPHRGVTQGATNDYETYDNNGNCLITFNSPSFDSNFTIEIESETGYAFIVGQPGS
jgi:prepilin-type N-terminal cleavage/methylation domain-containing protein